MQRLTMPKTPQVKFEFDERSIVPADAANSNKVDVRDPETGESRPFCFPDVAHEKGEPSIFVLRASDDLAAAVLDLIDRRILDSRSRAGDALLSYCDLRFDR